MASACASRVCGRFQFGFVCDDKMRLVVGLRSFDHLKRVIATRGGLRMAAVVGDAALRPTVAIDLARCRVEVSGAAASDALDALTVAAR